MRTRRAAASAGGLTLVQAELALSLVTISLAASTGRLFQTTSYLAALVATILAAHVSAAVLRRLGLPMGLSSAVLVVFGVVVIAWVHYPDLLTWGVPTPRTVVAMGTDLRESFGPFRTLTTPAPMSSGFEVALAAALWVLVVFADGATFSADAPVQALLPYAAAFTFTSILDRGNAFLGVAVACSGAVAVFALSVRMLRQARLAWASGDARWGTSFTSSFGVAMLCVPLVLGAVLVPLVPDTGGSGVVDLRRIFAKSGPRQVDSPLVGLQSLLNEQSDEVMFTVESPTPHYWRQTSLDEFSGTGWGGSQATYLELDSGERIPSQLDSSVPVTTETHRFTIEGLRESWLPAAFEPRSVRSDLDLRYHGGSSTLLLDDRAAQARDSYTVDSAVAEVDVARLEADPTRRSAADARYLDLPVGFSEDVVDLARDLTRQATDDYTRAKLLQDFFQGDDFSYDATVDYRNVSDPLGTFLFRDKRGFCQQYATAYAAMARVVGLPARVAVGFTFGEPDDAERPTRWTVRGRNAHAWPEVYIQGVGWIAMEPTPGRGNPDATAYTGIAADQDDEARSSTPTTAPGSTTVPASTTPTTAATAPASTTTTTALGGGAPAASSSGLGGLATAVLVGLAVLVVAVGGIAARLSWVRRRRTRRRTAERSGDEQVLDMWIDTCRDLRRVGIVPRPFETPNEFAARAADELGFDVLAELGPLESERRYASAGIDDVAAQRAVHISGEVRELVWSRLDARARMRGTLDL